MSDGAGSESRERSASRAFVRRLVPALGREVFRLGLACNYGIDERGFDRAIERGVEYVFWTHRKTGGVEPALMRVLHSKRDRIVLGAGPMLGFLAGNVRRGAESLLKKLRVERIDVFHLFWLGVGSALTDATMEAMARLKEEGKVGAFAVSIHDRKRAGELVKTSPIEWYMLRYNAAHPGAERDVFPNLKDAAKRPAVCAYTATSWRRLLKKPAGWSGEAMTPGDCYRFCLTSPNVDVALMGPSSVAHVDENLDALERGPLTADEEKWMRAFGQAVHG